MSMRERLRELYAEGRKLESERLRLGGELPRELERRARAVQLEINQIADSMFAQGPVRRPGKPCARTDVATDDGLRRVATSQTEGELCLRFAPRDPQIHTHTHGD